jgi:hypothetical protein
VSLERDGHALGGSWETARACDGHLPPRPPARAGGEQHVSRADGASRRAGRGDATAQGERGYRSKSAFKVAFEGTSRRDRKVLPRRTLPAERIAEPPNLV